MKRRKKVLLLSSLIAVLVGFNYLTYVWGNGVSTNHGDAGNAGSCGGLWCSRDSDYINWGIRISLVRDNGDQNGIAVDIFPDGTLFDGTTRNAIADTQTIFTITNPNNRLGRFETLKKAESVTGEDSRQIDGLLDNTSFRQTLPWSSMGIKRASQIDFFNVMKNAGYTLNISTKNPQRYAGPKNPSGFKDMSDDVLTIYHYLADVDSKNGYAELNKFFQNVLQVNNVDVSKLSQAEADDLYILIEPIIMHASDDAHYEPLTKTNEQRIIDSVQQGRNGGHMYYGTATEISLMYNFDLNEGKFKDVTYSSTDAVAIESRGQKLFATWFQGGGLMLSRICGFSKCALTGLSGKPVNLELHGYCGGSNCAQYGLRFGESWVSKAVQDIRDARGFQGFSIIWLGSIVTRDDCSKILEVLNDQYEKNLIDDATYHDAVKAVRDGTFDLENYAKRFDTKTGEKDDEGNDLYYTMTTPAKDGVGPYEMLDYSYYTNLTLNAQKFSNGNGKASCTHSPSAAETPCQQIVDKINALPSSAYTYGETYDDLITKVRNGTFTQTDAARYGIVDSSGNWLTLSTPQTFNLLQKQNYDVYAGGKATCRNVDGGCDPNMLQSLSYVDQNIDPCISGNSYLRENSDEQGWLKCEASYVYNNTIYSSENTGHEAKDDPNDETSYSDEISYTPGVVGNDEYCKIFCYETFDTNFPTSVSGVKAGQVFQWGIADNNFGEIKVQKHCTTKDYTSSGEGYQYNKWYNDYKANTKSKLENYVQWFAMSKANDLIQKATISSSTASNSCPGPCDSDGDGDKDETCDNVEDGTKYEVSIDAFTVSVQDPLNNNATYSFTVDNGAADRQHRTGSAIDCSGSADSAKSLARSRASYNTQTVAGYESTYSKKDANEPYYIKLIQQCTRSLKYIYKTTVQLDFSEPTSTVYGPNSRGFSSRSQLEPQEINYEEDNVDVSKCTPVSMPTFDCNEDTTKNGKCDITYETVYNCQENLSGGKVEWNFYGTWAYHYPIDEFTWWSFKVGDQLVNTLNKQPSEPEGYFYSLGFGLPTAFSLTDGTYPLKVIVSNIGDYNKTSATVSGVEVVDYNSQYGHFAPFLDSMSDDSRGFVYECTYEVTNEIFGYDCVYDENGNLLPESPSYCDPHKDDTPDGYLNRIDLVYRLVALLDKNDTTGTAGGDINIAFPSIDGSGREPGPNWRSLTDDEIRTVLDDQVYNGPAMYEIELDVAGIQYIRKDNRAYFNASSDPYTEYKDILNKYADPDNYKIICVNKDVVAFNNKYCASEFLTELHNHTNYGLNHWLEGTCFVGNTTRERAEEILNNDGVCGGTYDGHYENLEWERNN